MGESACVSLNETHMALSSVGNNKHKHPWLVNTSLGPHVSISAQGTASVIPRKEFPTVNGNADPEFMVP